MNWQTTDDGQTRCTAHGHTFGPLGYCPDCEAGGGAEAANERPSTSARDELRAWYLSERDFYASLAHQLADERDEREAKDRIGYSTIAKLGDVAIKYARAAAELIGKQGDEDFAAWLVEEKRRLLNRGASH